MFKILFAIILFFGLFLMLTGVVGVKILRALFGFGNKPSQQSKQDQTHTYSNSENREKIFKKHEGEYVEFEEIDEKHKEDLKEKDEQ